MSRCGRLLLLGGLAGAAGYLAGSGKISGGSSCGVVKGCKDCPKLLSCKDKKSQELRYHGK